MKENIKFLYIMSKYLYFLGKLVVSTKLVIFINIFYE